MIFFALDCHNRRLSPLNLPLHLWSKPSRYRFSSSSILGRLPPGRPLLFHGEDDLIQLNMGAPMERSAGTVAFEEPAIEPHGEPSRVRGECISRDSVRLVYEDDKVVGGEQETVLVFQKDLHLRYRLFHHSNHSPVIFVPTR